MSVAFASARPRGKGEVTQQTIQKVGRAAGVRSERVGTGREQSRGTARVPEP